MARAGRTCEATVQRDAGDGVLNRLGIRSRVLLLTLLPTSLMALVLGSYFTWLQQNDLRTQLMQRGK
jgi:two-component system sensor histidine kinase BarA